MKKLNALCVFLLLASAAHLFSAGNNEVKIAPADEPVYNTQSWAKPRYEVLKPRIVGKPCAILFVGDSITQQWETGPGRKIWERDFVPLGAVNFGISGDRTEHMLWRIDDTKLATTTDPKTCVVLAGTNNIGFWNAKQSADEIVDGIKLILKRLTERYPKTQIILMEVTLYGTDPNRPHWKLQEKVNAKLRRLANSKIKVVNLNKKFLKPDGTRDSSYFVDEVHLSEKGYQAWADTILPMLGHKKKR